MLVLDLNSSEYPQQLKNISKPPEKLYIKGNFSSEIFKTCLSVVGSRKMSPYGRRVTGKFVRNLADSGLTIVSGFMYGIDSEAHKSALSVGGKTIAVMPCGIDTICPSHQEALYRKILHSGGLIISEYPGKTPAKKWTFPQRNRIVAGLSQALFVVEAGEGSGTLITAKHAREEGREIYVPPGNLFSENFEGVSQLLKEGAKVACSPLEIKQYYLDNLGKKLQDSSVAFLMKKEHNLDSIEEQILSALKVAPLSSDELFFHLCISFSVLLSKLTSLSLRGLISEEGGRYYVN
jgi:DNA processing protein